MRPFRHRRRGGISAEFEPQEAALLTNLAAQLIELLRDRNGESQSSADPLAQLVGMSGPVLPPDDPVLARLLPDAYTDDPEASGEFRRYTEQTLTSGKVANAETIITSLREGGFEEDDSSRVEVELDSGQAMAWMRSLTDLRLALATRLGIETEEDHELLARDADEQTLIMLDIYDWLGFIQESLVRAVDR